MMTNLLEHVRFEGRPSIPSLRCEAVSSSPRNGRQSQCSRRQEVELQPDEHELIELVFRHAGLNVTDFRDAPLRRRLYAVLRAIRCETVAQAIARVSCSNVTAQRALTALVIGHTLPFRDAAVFRHLREVVIPQLSIAPRVWSIGCSRGLELLSVALLLDCRGTSGALLRGSDCRAPGPWLETTVAQDFIKAIPDDFAEPLSMDLRAWVAQKMTSIDWRVEDVLATRENHCWDLILCRNVSIYLQPAAARRLWHLVASALVPGAYLVTGKAENPNLPRVLRRVAHCVYQRQEGAVANEIPDRHLSRGQG